MQFISIFARMEMSRRVMLEDESCTQTHRLILNSPDDGVDHTHTHTGNMRHEQHTQVLTSESNVVS